MVVKCALLILCFELVSLIETFGQCAPVDFALPSNSCINENIDIYSSDTYLKYEWDFCSGDLDQTPSGSVFQNFAGAAFKVELVDQNGQYYGFYTSRSNRKLYRLDFGTDVTSTPTPVDLGDLGLSFSPLGWLTIEIVKEGNQYYGFIIDFYNRIYRFSFGSSLSNAPSTAELFYNGIFLINPIDLVIIEDETGKYAFVSNINDNKLVRFKFAQSFGEDVSATAIDAINTGLGTLAGVSFLRDCGSWYAMVSSPSGALAKIFFDSGLDDATPTISLITGLSFSAAFRGLALAFEDAKYYAFVQSSTNLYKVDFGNSLANSVVSSADLGGLGLFSDVFGFSMYKVNSDWLVLSSENSGSRIIRINFPSDCFSNETYSTAKDNTLVVNSAGTYKVSLATRSANGYLMAASKTINISNDTSPDIAFTSENICANHDVLFISQNVSGDVASYEWMFGDATLSAESNATHQYATAGNYAVSLSVTGNNGCKNSTHKDLNIYSEPVSDFTIPFGLICTNNEFAFVNKTTDNFDSNLINQWFVDNNLVATTRDLKYTFSAIGNSDIRLTTSIPGCSNELIQTLNNIQTGPTVDFDHQGNCENQIIQFANKSSGDIAEYLWDFGNGQTSTAVDVVQSYSSKGDYLVTLNTVGVNGCLSSTSKNLTINTTPQPNFSLDLPPFSCAGSPSQFNDLTPSPIDSNISSWNWSFGDAANGTATTKSPAYIYQLAGPYNVSLTATTNFGCTASISKSVQIADPPKAGFTISPSCLNQATNFTDTSSGTNKSWLWKIGSSSYTLQNPAHVFSNSGNFTAQLTVTGSNNCVSILSKPINVPVPPVVDFFVKNNCSGQNTLFEDVTPQSSDLAVSRAWDFGSKGTGSGASTQFSFSAPGVYNVKLTVTNQSGCNYTLTKNTSIVTAPEAGFITSVESGPPPLNVQFANTSLSATAFQWQFNDPANSTSKEVSPSFTYTSLGDFVIDLVASNAQGCIDTKSRIVHVIIPYTEIELEDFELLHDAVTGSVRPVLTIKNNSNYTISKVDVVLDIGGNASVKEKITTSILPNASSSQILNYELLPGGSQLSYLCAEVHLADDVNLVNNADCISLQSDQVIFPPYPNPVETQMGMDWIATSESNAKVTLLTQTGQIAYQKEVVGVGLGLNQITLDFSQLNSGFYILLFENAETKKTFPIVIQN